MVTEDSNATRKGAIEKSTRGFRRTEGAETLGGARRFD